MTGTSAPASDRGRSGLFQPKNDKGSGKSLGRLRKFTTITIPRHISTINTTNNSTYLPFARHTHIRTMSTNTPSCSASYSGSMVTYDDLPVCVCVCVCLCICVCVRVCLCMCMRGGALCACVCHESYSQSAITPQRLNSAFCSCVCVCVSARMMYVCVPAWRPRRTFGHSAESAAASSPAFPLRMPEDGWL